MIFTAFPNQQNRWPTRSASRTGHTLLELIFATVLMGAALVPALQLMQEGMEAGRATETRNLMSILCDSELEKQLTLAAANWNTGSPSGTFAAEGYASIRYSGNVSDNPSDGGITDQLMAITVTVWHDTNGNATLDSTENSVVMRSKISNLVVYEYEAQN